VESTGSASLNCKAETIERVADKAAFSDYMEARGVRVPETLVLNVREFARELQAALKDNLSFPLIFKSTDSTSCGGLSVVRTWDEVDTAVKKILAESLSEKFVVQEFVEGIAASVSLIASNGEALPITLNKQVVVLETPIVPSRYEGGLVPLDSPLRAEAFAVAKKTLQVFQDLSGYVGVDLVLTDDGPIVIEVNPRLTTSFVGLRNVANFNVAQALIDAAGKRALPKNLQTSGYSVFSKMPVPNPSAETYQRALGMQEVVCPPFLMAAEGIAYAFLCSKANTAENAQLKLREAKERLRRISEGGM
jgi:predicted ATP-grasp superfamily ATP-dependent carboligase